VFFVVKKDFSTPAVILLILVPKKEAALPEQPLCIT
jgi:hypothetical protein